MNRRTKLLGRHMGPGGKRCACCFPAPGSRARRQIMRSVKRKDEDLAIKGEFEAMSDGSAVCSDKEIVRFYLGVSDEDNAEELTCEKFSISEQSLLIILDADLVDSMMS